MMERILVGIDFEATAERAFETAVSMAGRIHCALELVHIAPFPPPTFEASAVAAIRAEREQRLQTFAERAVEKGIPVHCQVRFETPAFGLLEAIKESNPSFVVVGSHGRRGIGRAFLGSVSDELCLRSSVPVIVVPNPQRELSSTTGAFSCSDCGHLYKDGEPNGSCAQCGSRPARWISATIEAGPVDIAEAPVGEPLEEMTERNANNQSTQGLFSTSVAGVSGYDVNPELRVRY